MKDITIKNKDFIIKSIEKEINLFRKLYEKNTTSKQGLR